MFRRALLLIPTLVVLFAQNQAFCATSSTEFTLTGVLFSHTARSALVNGKIVREGERVDGIEILAIEEDAVRVLSGSEETIVPVGSGARLEPSLLRSVRSAPTDRRNASPLRQVNSGDTLSGIAEDYAGNGVSLNQVMVALFEANPQAFDGNINRLRAGAKLRVPENREIRRHVPETAMAEVLRQTETWRARRVRPIRVAQSPTPVEAQPIAVEVALEAVEYGPVGFGETLSEIAVQVSGDGVSMSQMMIALFEANPHAFGKSIDLLHEGAVLRVPDFDEINRTATLTAYNY